MSESQKQYVTYGSCGCGTCGAKNEITGCRFSLSPMSDRYADIILGAISRVDTSHVWKMTDKLSTVYRGKRIHVLDAVRACFSFAYEEGVHMTMEATISKGCPGDTDADSYLDFDGVPVNGAAVRDIRFPAVCKISLYPMGVANYMEHIAAVVNMAIDQGLYSHSSHYVTVLEGDIQDLFSYFDKATEYCSQHISHYIFEITLSVNSPTA